MVLAAPDLPKGELFEARVARLLTAEGGFARRRVNLEAQFGERFKVITDVDVLSHEFGGDLRLTRTAVECKTTESKGQPGIGDRLLWLAGLGSLIEADKSILATHKAPDRSQREIAKQLNCEILDPRDLAHREGILGLGPESNYGSHDPRLVAFDRAAFAAAKRDVDLKRVYWFTRSELWLAPAPAVIKRGLGALRLLGGRWSDKLPVEERMAVEWLSSEVSVGMVLAMVRLASVAYRQPEETFERELSERLAEGVADYLALQEISKQVDKYLIGVLTSAGVTPTMSTGALGAFSPQPPPYIEPLAEVIVRIARAPSAARELPRLADGLFAGHFLATLGVPAGEREDGGDPGRLVRIIAAFLEGQAKLPPMLLSPIKRQNGTEAGAGAPDGAVTDRAEPVPMFPGE